MKNAIWGMIVVASFSLAFLAGYHVSARTGVEPGYFEAPAAAGYGAGAEGEAPAGVSGEMQQYYKELAK